MNVKWNVLLNTKEKEGYFKSNFLEKLSQDVKNNEFGNINFSFNDEILSISFNIDRELNEADLGYISMAFGSYLRNILKNDVPGFIVLGGETKKIDKNSYVFEADAVISEIEVLHLIKTSIRKNSINVSKLIDLLKD